MTHQPCTGQAMLARPTKQTAVKLLSPGAQEECLVHMVYLYLEKSCLEAGECHANL